MAQRFQNPVLVGVVVTLVGIASAMTQYRVPTIMLDLMALYGMGAQAASWLMSIFCLVMIFVAIPISTLAQRVGPRPVVFGAVALIVVGALLGAFAPSLAPLMVSRAIEGIALTAITICCPVLIESSIHPTRIGTGLGIWGTWGPLGSTFAALLTPTLFRIMGFTPFWLLYAGLVVITTLIMAVVVKAPSKSAGGAEAEEVPQAAAPADSSYTPRYKDVFCKNTILFFIGFLGFNLCLLATLSYVPAILQGKGYNPTVSGFVSTLPMLLSLISSILFGALSDKLHNTRLLLVISVFFLGPCTLALYTLTGAGMWIAAILMGLIGMGSTGLMIVGLMKALPDPRLKTLGMGVLITVQGIGQFLGAFFVQLMLGPNLDMQLRAGIVVAIIGIIAAICLGFCTFNERLGEGQ